MFGGEEKITQMITNVCIQKPTIVFLPNVGHWFPQEKSAETNALLLTFLEHAAAKHAPSPKSRL